MMQCHTGGVQSPFTVLLAMPMIWFGLMGSAGEAGVRRGQPRLTDPGDRRLTERLRGAAVHDQLTGLLNRRGWEEVAARAVDGLAPGASGSRR